MAKRLGVDCARGASGQFGVALQLHRGGWHLIEPDIARKIVAHILLCAAEADRLNASHAPNATAAPAARHDQSEG